MTEWCSCNMLKEAQEKAAKWDAIVRCGECKWREVSALNATVCPDWEAFEDPDGFCKWGRRNA